MASLVRRLTFSSGRLVSSEIGRRVSRGSGTASGTPCLSESGLRFKTSWFPCPISGGDGDGALASDGMASGS